MERRVRSIVTDMERRVRSIVTDMERRVRSIVTDMERRVRSIVIILFAAPSTPYRFISPSTTNCPRYSAGVVNFVATKRCMFGGAELPPGFAG